LADPADRLAAHGQAHLLEHRAGLGAAERAAFDVTPAANISAIITEHGVRRPPYTFG
jgi:translation initiation factor 2B subunit (eIF-2B alpha/beta/delta family)